LEQLWRSRPDYPPPTETYSYMAPPPLMEVEEEQEIKVEALYPVYNFDEKQETDEEEADEEMSQQVNFKLEEEEVDGMTQAIIDPIG
jgi:hypothetical protein